MEMFEKRRLAKYLLVGTEARLPRRGSMIVRQMS
jgi:hypothetical protein